MINAQAQTPQPQATVHQLRPTAPAVHTLTLRGRIGGNDAELILTAATMTELASEVAIARALFDDQVHPAPAVAAPAAPDPDVCPTHGRHLKTSRYGGKFCPDKDANGAYCSFKTV